MKKLFLPFIAIMLYGSLSHAQNAIPNPAAGPKPVALPVAATDDQKMQQLAGLIYSCTTTKPLLGWKFITISLDRMSAEQLSISGYATMNNNTVKKIDLCDKQQIAQSLIDMYNITTKGKGISWQALLFRTKPDRQFEFTPLSDADINQITQSAKTATLPLQ